MINDETIQQQPYEDTQDQLSQLDSQTVQEASIIEANGPLRLKMNGAVIMIYGKTRSGKSWLAKHLWKKSGYDKDHTYLVCPTYHGQSGMKNTYDGCHILTTGYRRADYSTIRNSMVIFDDVIGALKGNATFIDLIMHKYHWSNSIIIISQFPTNLKPEIRDNCTASIVFNYASEDVAKKFHAYYLNQYFEGWKETARYIRSLRRHEFIIETDQRVCKAMLR